MKRRSFIGKSAGTAGALAALSGCEGNTGKKVSQTPHRGTIGKIGDKTLEELREQYRIDLLDDFLPFLEKYVIDHQYGGFMTNTDRKGNNVTKKKGSTTEGRGIFVWSYIFNHVDPAPKHLEVARKSVEFILRHKPSGDKFWPGGYTQEGEATGESTYMFQDMYIALGLAEYSKAAKDDSAWKLAKETLQKCMRAYDAPDYPFQVTYGPNPAPKLTGQRVLGHWMNFIFPANRLLLSKSDPEVEEITDRCIDAIMNYHYNPDFDLFNEVLNHDLSRTDDAYAQFCYTGTAIQTLWMVLHEALRRKDRALFDRAADRIKRHIEVAWDDVYGGAFRSLIHIDDNTWGIDKVLWLQEEFLICALCIIEHTGAQWAKDWFAKVFDYMQDKFPGKQYDGCPIWILYTDRKVTFDPEASYVGNFHHPRHLAINLSTLNRIIENGGKISKVFV